MLSSLPAKRTIYDPSSAIHKIYVWHRLQKVTELWIKSQIIDHYFFQANYNYLKEFLVPGLKGLNIVELEKLINRMEIPLFRSNKSERFIPKGIHEDFLLGKIDQISFIGSSRKQ